MPLVEKEDKPLDLGSLPHMKKIVVHPREVSEYLSTSAKREKLTELLIL